MVKSFKYILTRVLIGVGIAIVLMSLKGGLIGNVYAEDNPYFTLNNNNVSSCANPNPCTYYQGTAGQLYWGSSSNNLGSGIYYTIPNNITEGYYTITAFAESFIFAYPPNNNTSSSIVTGSQNAVYAYLYKDSQYYDFKFYQQGPGFYQLQVENIYLKPGDRILQYFSAYNINPHNGNNAISVFMRARWSSYNDTNSVTTAIQEQTQATNETNSILEDSNVSSDTNSSLESILQPKDSNTPVADLLLLPLTLFNAYLTGFNGECASFNLGTLFNHQISLPCINLGNLLGSTLWSLIDVIFCLFMIFNIAQLFIYMFESITSLEDPYRDVYVHKHTYQPKHGGDN